MNRVGQVSPVLGVLMGVVLCGEAVCGQAPFPFPTQALMDIDENQVWEGTVTIHETGEAHDARDDSKDGRIDTYHYDHSIDSTVAIAACGPLTGMHVSYVSKNRSDTLAIRKNKRKHVKIREETSENTGPRTSWPKPNLVSRLDADTMEKTLKTVFYEGDIPKSQQDHGGKDGGEISFMLVPPNRYMLVVGCDLFLAVSGHEHSERIWPTLDEKTDRTNVQFATCPFEREPQSTVEVSDLDVEITRVEAHPIRYVLGLGVPLTGEFTKEEIRGTQVLIDETAKRPGDLTRKVVVTWSFKPQGDPCQAVYDLLYQDLAWAEAYNDPDLRGMAGNLSEYKSLVGHRAAEIYGDYLPPGMMGASVSMSVDPNTCGIEGLDKAKELAENRCLPDVIVEAVLDHELRHAKQCQEEGEAFRDVENLENRARFEIDAHIAGIKRLMKYVEEHCEKSGNLYNIDTARQRLERLEAANRR